MKKVSSLFFLIFVFLLPFNIKFLGYTSPLSNIYSDFNGFFVYPSEFFLLLSFILFPKSKMIRQQSTSWRTTLLLTGIIFAIPSFFLARDHTLALLTFIRILECYFTFFLLSHHIAPLYAILLILGTSMLGQSILAMVQYSVQHSLGLSFLGESAITKNTSNIATIDVGSTKILRAYGTFPHPNILGGFLSSIIILFLIFKDIVQRTIGTWWWRIALLCFMLGLFFTFSRSAILGLFTGFLFLFMLSNRKNTILLPLVISSLFFIGLSLLFPFFTQRFTASTTEDTSRMHQYQVSWMMIQRHPFGVGLGNDTLQLEQENTTPVSLWDIQPVHNTFLLLTNEIGIIPGIIFLIFFIFLFYTLILSTQRVLIALLVTISVPLVVDHYFYTSFQGLMLMGIMLGIIFVQAKRVML